MDRKVKSFRVRTDLLEWLETYAASRGAKQIDVLESALVSFKAESEGGVPDLPVPDTKEVRQQRAAAPQYDEERMRAAWLSSRQHKLNMAKYGKKA